MNYRKLPTITKKQEEILTLIYRFRFINRKQLQRYLKHKDARRINTWLRDLVEKKYLGRIYSHKLLENTKPAIYYLHNNGIVWIRYEKELEIQQLKKFYQDKTASETFVNHCVSLFEFFLQLKEVEEKSSETVEYSVETKTEMWTTRQLHGYTGDAFEEIKTYLPDLFWEKLKNPYSKSITSSTYFLELFDPKMPRYAIQYRIKQYIKLKEEEKWEYYSGLDGKFPIIMLLFPNQQRINFHSKYIKDQLERSYESKDLIFLVTTQQKALTEGILNPKIWKEMKEN